MFISSIRFCSICSNDCNANNLPTQVNFKLSIGSTTTTTATKLPNNNGFLKSEVIA